MPETLVIKRIDGRYWKVVEGTEIRVCLNGACDTQLSQEWDKPLCPCCTFQRNVEAACTKVKA